MASKLTRVVFRSIKGRSLSTRPAADVQDAGVVLPKQDFKITKLPSGLVVASLEDYSPVSRIAVVVNAGSRFEDHNDIGVAHCLRAAAGLTTRDSSAFGIARNIQQIGGNIQCTGSREYITYSAECIRDHVGTAVKVLKDITTGTNFFPWELSDMQKERLTYDLAVLRQQPNVRLFEMLHQAAFRNTLGRSLYCPEHKIGSYSVDQLSDYVSKHYTSGKMAVVGLGVDHDYLISEVKHFQPSSTPDDTKTAAQYHNGEIRDDTGGPLTYAALAVEGQSLADKDLFSAVVLQHLMGVGPYVKYSDNTVCKLGKAVSAVTSHSCAVSCFSANYTDAGLFGFYAISEPEAMDKILKAGMDQFANMTKGNIADKDVEIAKNQLKTHMAMVLEDGSSMITNMTEQILYNQQIASYKSMVPLIDKITAADVTNVAKKLFNGKPCMAATGNLSHTPHVDELYK